MGSEKEKKSGCAGRLVKVLLLLVLLAGGAGVVCYFFFPEILEKYVPLPGRDRLVASKVGVSVALPADWKSAIASVGSPALILSGPAGETISIIYERVNQKVTPAEYALDNATARKVTTNQPPQTLEIDGAAGWMISGELSGRDGSRGMLFYHLRHQKRMYTVSCSAFGGDFKNTRPELEKIVKSLRFLK
jgi:hypothetical protein